MPLFTRCKISLGYPQSVYVKFKLKIFFYSMLILSFFEGEQKNVVLCVPLNANKLLLPAQRAELQELVCLEKCQKTFRLWPKSPLKPLLPTPYVGGRE